MEQWLVDGCSRRGGNTNDDMNEVHGVNPLENVQSQGNTNTMQVSILKLTRKRSKSIQLRKFASRHLPETIMSVRAV